MDMPIRLWDLQQPLRSLYTLCIEPVCRDYGVTRTELDILLFLDGSPEHDTAAEIADQRCLAKSHVSTSIQSLERNGYLTRLAGCADRRLIHLRLSEKAARVIQAGKDARDVFLGIITAGLDEEERARLHADIERMEENILSYLAAAGGKQREA